MKRNSSIDLMKSSAIFFVVSVHFLLNSGFYDMTIHSTLGIIWIGMRTILITCVPLFLVATGFLMNRKQLSAQYVLGIVPVIVSYLGISLLVWGTLSAVGKGSDFSTAINGIFDYSTDSYSWYVEMYLGLYLFIPLLNIIWNYKKEIKNYHLYIVFISSLLTFLSSLLNSFGKVLPDYWQICYPVSYYFIGAYLYTYQEEIKKISNIKIISLFTLALATFTLTDTLASWNREFQWLDHNDYFGYQTAIMTVLIIIIIWKIPVPKWSQRLLKSLSTATLSIYLISDLTDQFVYGFFKLEIPNLSQRVMAGPMIIPVAFSSAALAGILVGKILGLPFKKKENRGS